MNHCWPLCPSDWASTASGENTVYTLQNIPWKFFLFEDKPGSLMEMISGFYSHPVFLGCSNLGSLPWWLLEHISWQHQSNGACLVYGPLTLNSNVKLECWCALRNRLLAPLATLQLHGSLSTMATLLGNTNIEHSLISKTPLDTVSQQCCETRWLI